jgi:protein arginine N-methyltransferase 7
MSTDPEATRDNFPRDMQWGQALQLVEDTSVIGTCPVPLVVKKGDELEMLVRFSRDKAVMQFEISKKGGAAADPAADVGAEFSAACSIVDSS